MRDKVILVIVFGASLGIFCSAGMAFFPWALERAIDWWDARLHGWDAKAITAEFGFVDTWDSSTNEGFGAGSQLLFVYHLRNNTREDYTLSDTWGVQARLKEPLGALSAVTGARRESTFIPAGQVAEMYVAIPWEYDEEPLPRNSKERRRRLLKYVHELRATGFVIFDHTHHYLLELPGAGADTAPQPMTP